MAEVLQNIGLILLFIVIGGVFAAAEMALVSLRQSQIDRLSHKGKRGLRVSRLAQDPNLFLSAVQIGVTMSGFLSAAFGGATLAEDLAPVFVSWGLPVAFAEPLALVLITMLISYVSIVIGELTAKRLAMQRSEGFSLALAPFVHVVVMVFKPLIWWLGVSTNFVVRILGGDPMASREEVTDEELRAMVGQSQTLSDDERKIMDDVFSAGQVSLREAMIPRTEVDFLDGGTPAYKVVREVGGGAHSRYPVVGDTPDDVLGFVHVRDLFDLDPEARTAPVSQLVRPVLALPQSLKVIPALSEMRRQAAHMAVVQDEYGGTAGIVTLEDLVEELVGDITDEYDPEDTEPAREGNDLDGLLTLEEFADRTGLELAEGPYDTIAGFLMARVGRLLQLGDSAEVDVGVVGNTDLTARCEFTVTELDGRRASRLSMRRLETVED